MVCDDTYTVVCVVTAQGWVCVVTAQGWVRVMTAQGRVCGDSTGLGVW